VRSCRPWRSSGGIKRSRKGASHLFREPLERWRTPCVFAVRRKGTKRCQPPNLSKLGKKFPATFSAISIGFESGLLQARLPDDGPERPAPEFGVIRDGYGYRACRCGRRPWTSSASSTAPTGEAAAALSPHTTQIWWLAPFSPGRVEGDRIDQATSID